MTTPLPPSPFCDKPSKAKKALHAIMKAGLLDDRREYDEEMLARMYKLTASQARELRHLIQES
jgi:DNA-binding PadR family transcriptional regulator